MTCHFSFLSKVLLRVELAEQELHPLPEQLSSNVCLFDQSLMFCVVFWESLLVVLFFFATVYLVLDVRQ